MHPGDVSGATAEGAFLDPMDSLAPLGTITLSYPCLVIRLSIIWLQVLYGMACLLLGPRHDTRLRYVPTFPQAIFQKKFGGICWIRWLICVFVVHFDDLL